MDTFKTLIVPAALGLKAVAICDALGYPDKGMFTAKIADGDAPEMGQPDTRAVVAYIASGIVDSESPVLADAATLWAAVQATEDGPGTLTLLDCQAFKTALEATDASPIPQAASIVAEVAGTFPAPLWVQPLGAHDAYVTGAAVTHNNKKWRNLTPYNTFAPGVSGWREFWKASGAPPDWIQPTGAHDAYPIGAKVTHKGFVWTSANAANTWEPGVFGWVKD